MPISNYLFSPILQETVTPNSAQKKPFIVEKNSFLIFNLFKKMRYFSYPSFTLKDRLTKERAPLKEDPLSQLPLEILELVIEHLPLVDRKNLSQTAPTFYCDLGPLYLLDQISSGTLPLRQMKYLMSKEGKNVRSLDLSSYPLSSKDLKLISYYCPYLKSLKLGNCWQISGKALIKVAERLPRLQFLDLSFCQQISDTILIEVAKHLPQLQSLNLSWCQQISGKALIEVAKHLPRLQFLDLSFCKQISDATLIKSIKEHCPQFNSSNFRDYEQITKWLY
jgi:Leucine-rich repeat (LRR) protein